jgi:hypothetical protein
LKPEFNKPLSIFAFKFNVCHYNSGDAEKARVARAAAAGAYTRPLFGST